MAVKSTKQVKKPKAKVVKPVKKNIKKSTTKQVKKPTLKNGNPINEKAQFGKPGGNPRHNGAWKKEDTPRYKLEQMMKLTSTELKAIYDDRSSPYFERKLARAIYDGDWGDIERMINQVYGMPTQKIQNSTTDLPINVTDEELNDAIFERSKKK